jgi:hypothetical protein
MSEEIEIESATEIGRLMFYDNRDSSRSRLASATFEPFHDIKEYKERSIRAAERAIKAIGISNAHHICIKVRTVGSAVIPFEEIIKAVIKDIPGISGTYCKF